MPNKDLDYLNSLLQQDDTIQIGEPISGESFDFSGLSSSNVQPETNSQFDFSGIDTFDFSGLENKPLALTDRIKNFFVTSPEDRRKELLSRGVYSRSSDVFDLMKQKEVSGDIQRAVTISDDSGKLLIMKPSEAHRYLADKEVDENFDKLQRSYYQEEFADKPLLSRISETLGESGKTVVRSSRIIAGSMLGNGLSQLAETVNSDLDKIRSGNYTDNKFTFNDVKTMNDMVTHSKDLLFDLLNPKDRFYESNIKYLNSLYNTGRITDDDINKAKLSMDMLSAAGRMFSDEVTRQAYSGMFKPSPIVTQSTWSSNPLIKTTQAISNALPSLGASVYVAGITKNPYIGLTVLGALQEPEIYRTIRDKNPNLSVEDANTIALTTTIGEMILEKYPFDFILKGATGKIIPDMLISGLSEGSEEVLQQIWENTLEIWSGDEAKDYFEGTLDAFVGGAGSGMGLTSMTPKHARRIQELENKARKAGVPQEDLDAIKEQVGSLILEQAKNIDSKLQSNIKTQSPRENVKTVIGENNIEFKGKKSDSQIITNESIEQEIKKDKELIEEPIQKTTVSAENQPLLEEAKKYDSAEDFVKAQKEKTKAVRHYTYKENIEKIMKEGFDTSKTPIHGTGGLGGGAKTGKSGKDVLYFTTDDDRWSTAVIFVGEGKGDITKSSYNYERQKWFKEENAYKKVNLSPIEASIKSNAKTAVIDSLQKAKQFLKGASINFDRFNFIDTLVEAARLKGYDILNLQNPGGTEWDDIKPNKYGKLNIYEQLTGGSGKDDYFILNKDILNFDTVPTNSESKLSEIWEQAHKKGIANDNKYLDKEIEMNMGIPLNKEIDKLGNKMDVQAPFNRIGAKDTGLSIKAFFSNVSLNQEKGLDLIRTLTNGKKPGDFKRRFPKLIDEDYSDLIFATENPDYFNSLDESTQKRLYPYKEIISEYYNKNKSMLNEQGINVDFFGNIKNRLEQRNAELESLINKINEGNENFINLYGKKFQEWVSEYKDNSDIIDKISNNNFQFVHVPVNLWFNEKEQLDPIRFRKILKYLTTKNRKTILIKDLVDTGILNKEDIDIRDTIASYTNRVAKDMAWSTIINSAKKDGLIINLTEDGKIPSKYSDNFVTLPQIDFPLFRKNAVNKAFADFLIEFNYVQKHGNSINKILAAYKMFQFYNPLIMPMYDILQAAMLGSSVNYKMPIYLFRAIKSVALKDSDYYTAYKNGLFSTPYANPYSEFMKDYNKIKRSRTVAGKLMNVVSGNLGLAYTLSWNTAWTLDRVVRMMSYNYLKSKGLPSIESAQTAALFHGDYASVPAGTRKALNKIFFTPTFKIVMGKLYYEMLKSVPKTFTGKSDKIKSRGLLYTAAILFGKHYFMVKNGFESEHFSRRYYRSVDTDNGEKELVLTFANPANIALNYFYKVKDALDDDKVNKLESLVNSFKWDFHPLYLRLYETITNMKPNGDYVYNPTAEGWSQIKDMLQYNLTEMVKITRAVLDKANDEDKKAALSQLSKEIGQAKSILLDQIAYPYLRKTKGERAIYKLNNINREFERYINKTLRKDESADIDKSTQWFIDKIEKIEKELD